MLDRTTELTPVVAQIRKLVERKGKFFVSLDGMNSLYMVPEHLKGIFDEAVAGKCAVSITTTTEAIATAELAPSPRVAQRRTASAGKTRRYDRR